MRASAFPFTLGPAAPSCGGLSRLLVAVMLTASGRIECQEAGGTEPPDAGALQEGCRSVVLVRCAQAPPKEVPTDPAASRQATQQKLDARRLRQLQSQVGLNTVEVTGERPPQPESDPWEDFRQSLSGAAVPECFSPDAQPRQPLAVQGLLRLPLLVGAAAAGKCR